MSTVPAMSDRFAEARQRLSKEIGTDGVAIVPAAGEEVRSHDVHFDFHQDPDFLYLTGFNEPDAIAVVAPGHDDGDYALFVRPRDPEKQAWTGYRAGVEGAKERYGADAAFDVGKFDEVIRRYMLGREVLWYKIGNPTYDERMTSLLNRSRAVRDRLGTKAPSSIMDLSTVLGEMRLIKTASEAKVLEKACELSAQGHREAMRFAAPGHYEYQVQAVTEYPWRMSGARHNGYPSIVAAGANACILHYVQNDARVEADDLILIDAAAEIEGYSADITRTFPANGKFNAAQRALYEVVLAAEKIGVAGAVPGASFAGLDDAAVRILTEGLVDLGLLPRSVGDSLSMHHYRSFFFHGLGHWLGLDVHDRSASRIEGAHRPFEPGMSFTIEPGLYVSPSKPEIELTLLEYSRDEWLTRRVQEGDVAASIKEAAEREGAEKVTHVVPEEFLGLGIRIEDDLLVTPDGNINMSASVPVEIDEIEALCGEAPQWVISPKF